MDARLEQDWMAHYRSAMLEIDLSVLAQRIRTVEQAIEERKRQISAQLGSQREIQSMNDALQNLRVLKKELSAPPIDQYHSHPELEGTYVAFVSSDRRYVAVTDGVCKLLGYTREELLAKKIDDVTAPELQPTVPGTFKHYVQQGHLQGNFTLLTKDGRRVAMVYEALVFPDGCMTARWHPLTNSSPESTELNPR